MNEDQLRAIVRETVARQLGRTHAPATPAEPAWKTHASHLRLAVASGQEADGPCFIEPRVACNHCGYCQSLGH